MKLYFLLFSFVCCTEGAMSQQNDTLRSFKLIVAKKKGNSLAYAFFLGKNKVKPLPQSGTLFFDQVHPEDTLGLMINSKYYYFPVNGLDSVSIIINRDKLYDGRTEKAREGTKAPLSNTPTTLLDMENASMYANLAEYLRGRVPGLSVSTGGRNPVGGYQIQIRGVNSIHFQAAPLFVIDGVAVGDYEKAAASINVNEIKSVEVLRDGAGYGTLGSAGVILVTMKKGGD